jgi:hypothetical protein
MIPGHSTWRGRRCNRIECTCPPRDPGSTNRAPGIQRQAMSNLVVGSRIGSRPAKSIRQFQHHQPASTPYRHEAPRYLLPDLSLQFKQSVPTFLRTVRLQHPVATLTCAQALHTHLFHRICKLARPMDTPLCRICVYSHTS